MIKLRNILYSMYCSYESAHQCLRADSPFQGKLGLTAKVEEPRYLSARGTIHAIVATNKSQASGGLLRE